MNTKPYTNSIAFQNALTKDKQILKSKLVNMENQIDSYISELDKLDDSYKSVNKESKSNF